MYAQHLFYLIPMLFVAGVLDAIAGGGGIIALPAYMITGMPIHSAYACNKLQSGFGTLCSAAKFVKDKYADIKITLCALPFTILASFLATQLMMRIDSDTIKIIILVMIPLAAVMMFLKRKITSKDVISHPLTVKTVLLSMLAGTLLGSYDAFFGPGGGTVAMILFSILLSYDLRVGNGNGKIIIFASNITAMINYIISGHMIWYIAIPCAVANMIGSYIGASIAIKKGEKIVFPTMIVVISLLIVQTVVGFIISM